MTTPIKKKICMLGAFAVGKTSLIRRYVDNMFSERYKTTIGVKVDKKIVNVGEHAVDLVLWDLAGKDGISDMRTTYLRGASGYLVVVDKTRINTLEVGIQMHKMAQEMLGKVPCLLLFNKWDLEGKWDIDEATIAELQRDGWETIKTSAKTGMSVDDAFALLARKLIE